MAVGLKDICLELVTKPLPEAADWEKYFSLVINLFSASTANLKDIEIFFSGSFGEGGKHYRADDIGDVDIMISSLETIRKSTELEDVQGCQGFVKIKSVDDDGESAYYGSKRLKVRSFDELPERTQAIISIISKGISLFGDIKVAFHPKPGGAAYGFLMYSNHPYPSKNSTNPMIKVNPLVKSLLSDYSRDFCHGFGNESDIDHFQELLNNFYKIVEEIVEERANEEPFDIMEGVFKESIRLSQIESNAHAFGGEDLSINQNEHQPNCSESKHRLCNQQVKPRLDSEKDDPPTRQTDLLKIASENRDTSIQQMESHACTGSSKTEPNDLVSQKQDFRINQDEPNRHFAEKENQASNIQADQHELTTEDEQDISHSMAQVMASGKTKIEEGIKKQTIFGYIYGSEQERRNKEDDEMHILDNPASVVKNDIDAVICLENFILKYLSDFGSKLHEVTPQGDGKQDVFVPLFDFDSKHVKLFDGTVSDMTQDADEKSLLRESGIDIVPAIKFVGWPEIAAEWCTRARKWPCETKIKEIISGGFHVVGKRPKEVNVKDQDDTFRLSFSMPEKLLCNAMNEVQLHTYRVMKALHHEEFKPISKHISSYHIKTLLFWTCEKNENWNDLGDSVLLILFNLYEALENRKLDHYFISQCNLLSDFDDDEIEKLISRVSEIFLSPEESIRSLLKKIEEKADEVLKNTYENSGRSSEPVAVPPALEHQTFHQIWSEQYDRVSSEIILALDTGVGPDDLSEDFIYAIQIIGADMEDGKLLLPFVECTLLEIKRLAYCRHSCNYNDMMNEDVRSIALSDVRIIADFLRYIASRPANEIDGTPEGCNRLMTSLCSDDTEFSMRAFLPDPDVIIESLIKIAC